MELQTNRLILRAWQESEAEIFYKYAKNPNVALKAGWQPHTNVERSCEVIKAFLLVSEVYAIVLKEIGEPIGTIGIVPRSEMNSDIIGENECEIGCWIGEPFWGQGLIPEALKALLKHAFETLNYTVVWCGYYDGNERSKRVLEKCGFVFSHTEYNKPAPLPNDFRTEHFFKLTFENWKKIKDR